MVYWDHESTPPSGISINSAVFAGLVVMTNTLTALCQDMHRNSPHLALLPIAVMTMQHNNDLQYAQCTLLSDINLRHRHLQDSQVNDIIITITVTIIIIIIIIYYARRQQIK